METLEEKLIGYVTGHENIVIAYLFRSEATRLTHPGSDVDVALLFRLDKIPATDQLLQIQDELTSLLKKEDSPLVFGFFLIEG